MTFFTTNKPLRPFTFVSSLYLSCTIPQPRLIIRYSFFVVWLCVWWGGGVQALAQSSPLPYPSKPIVRSVEITGQTLFPTAQLLPLIQTEANRTLLGMSGVTPWLWIYRWGKQSRLPKKIKEAIQKSGEPPAELDPIVLRKDTERLKTFFLQQGYRAVTVSSLIKKADPDSQTVHVVFQVVPGTATYVRFFEYRGLSHLDPSQIARLLAGSKLYKGPANLQVFRFKGYDQRYEEPKLLEERRRITNFLQDEGYPEITRDSIKVWVTPVHRDSFDVAVLVKTGRRYRMGDVLFEVKGADESPARTDTLHILTNNPKAPLSIRARREGDTKLNPWYLADLMQFEAGAWYKQSKLLETKLILEQTGLFPFTNFAPVFSEAKLINGERYVPVRIDLRTRQRFAFNSRASLLQRYNTGNSDEWGLGASISFTDQNVWGRGERFQSRASASGTLERGFTFSNNETQTAYKRSTQYDASLSWTFPYFRRPFTWLGPLFGVPFYNARTRFSMSYLHDNRDVIKLKRDRAAFQYRVEMKHNTAVSSSLDLFDFTFSDPSPLEGFEELFLSKITDPIQRQRYLDDYTVRKINNAFRYTLRGSNADPLRRDKGFSSEFGWELGGNLPYLLDHFVLTPSVLSGSLKSLTSGSEVAYRQYSRFYLDFRQYRPISENSTLAWKAMAGWAFPLGSHLEIPKASRCGAARTATYEDCRDSDILFDRRFFVGGSTSVRAWNLGELGPGSKTGYQGVSGGDIKFESSVELRTILARNIFGGDYMVAVFADAGNVWYDRRNEFSTPKFDFTRAYKELGIGAGIGLRIVWPYFILRLDWAVQVYRPDGTLFPEGIRFRFIPGLGQAF